MSKLKNHQIIIDFLHINDESLIEGILLEDSTYFKYIKDPSRKIKKMALRMNPSMLQFCKNPSFNLQKYALNESGLALKYIKQPSKKLILLALQNNGMAIHFVKRQLEEYCILAISTNLFSFFCIKKLNENILDFVLFRLNEIKNTKTTFSTLVIDMFINKIISRNNKKDSAVFVSNLFMLATEGQKEQLLKHCNYKNQANLVFDKIKSLNS